MNHNYCNNSPFRSKGGVRVRVRVGARVRVGIKCWGLVGLGLVPSSLYILVNSTDLQN